MKTSTLVFVLGLLTITALYTTGCSDLITEQEAVDEEVLPSFSPIRNVRYVVGTTQTPAGLEAYTTDLVLGIE